jgi:glycosyltransferase involved in cell wall biosynthesis
MKICICVNTLLAHDAIGNDVACQWAVLKQENLDAAVYTDTSNRPEMADALMDEGELAAFMARPGNLLIYHHAGHWGRGQRLLEAAACRVFVKYHNITPPRFFSPYTPFYRLHGNYERFCRNGIRQTREIVSLGKVERYLCASRFNARDFSALGVAAERIFIVPPFHRLEDFKQAEVNPDLARTLDDGKLNLLFVGRLVPNKGHRHLIAVAARYAAMYDRRVRLVMIGKIDPGLAAYQDQLTQLIETYRLQDIVAINGAVSFRDLHTYYAASHVFLLMSLHEGFCVPVLEAQQHRLPIVALAAGAVPETLGPNQLVLDTPDHKKFAAAVHLLYREPGFRQYLAEQGVANLTRFSSPVLEKVFLESILAPAGKRS